MKPALISFILAFCPFQEASSATPANCKISPEQARWLADLYCTKEPLSLDVNFWEPSKYWIMPAERSPSYHYEIDCVSGEVHKHEANIGGGES